MADERKMDGKIRSRDKITNRMNRSEEEYFVKEGKVILFC